MKVNTSMTPVTYILSFFIAAYLGWVIATKPISKSTIDIQSTNTSISTGKLLHDYVNICRRKQAEDDQARLREIAQQVNAYSLEWAGNIRNQNHK